MPVCPYSSCPITALRVVGPPSSTCTLGSRIFCQAPLIIVIRLAPSIPFFSGLPHGIIIPSSSHQPNLLAYSYPPILRSLAWFLDFGSQISALDFLVYIRSYVIVLMLSSFVSSFVFLQSNGHRAPLSLSSTFSTLSGETKRPLHFPFFNSHFFHFMFFCRKQAMSAIVYICTPAVALSFVSCFQRNAISVLFIHLCRPCP